MRKAPAGLLAQVPAEHGCSAAEVILSAGMFMASGRLTRHLEQSNTRQPAGYADLARIADGPEVESNESVKTDQSIRSTPGEDRTSTSRLAPGSDD
jgi:hypothetical protein